MLKHLFQPLLDWYQHALETGGYFVIGLLMTCESSVLPLPSESIIPLAASWSHTGKIHLGIPGIVAAGFAPANPYGVAAFDDGTGRQTQSHEIGHDLGLQHDVSSTLFGYRGYVWNGTKWVSVTTTNYTTNTSFSLGHCGEVGSTNSVYPLFQTVDGQLQPALGPLNKGTNAFVFGVDTLTLDSTNLEPVLSPFQYFDLMSYCRGGLEDRWAGTFTYQTLMAAINGSFTAPPPPPPIEQLRRWLFVRGQIDPVNEVAEYEPFVAVDTAEVPPSPPTGGYSLVLRDGSGNLLYSVPFAPQSGADEDDSEPALDDFIIPIPIDLASQPVPIREIEVWDGVMPLADIVGSTNFPSVSSVTLTATNGGPFNGSGGLNIGWVGLDADPNVQLSYTLQYSSAGGTNWQTLAVDLAGENYSLDSRILAPTTQGQIRVMASDGFNCSDPAYSTLFTVKGHAPLVTILAPMNGSSYIGDQQVFFTASADDPQDGSLDGGNVVWSSSLDGVLGTGDTLSAEADTLSEGTHQITVTALDSLGLTNSAQATIYVLRLSPPTLEIQLLGNQIELSWPSSITNYLLESSTSLAPAAWAAVTNAPMAADITQTVNLNLSTTNRFFRLRMP